jgi:hypothetical protein
MQPTPPQSTPTTKKLEGSMKFTMDAMDLMDPMDALDPVGGKFDRARATAGLVGALWGKLE